MGSRLPVCLSEVRSIRLLRAQARAVVAELRKEEEES